jgi:hypothetical protein
MELMVTEDAPPSPPFGALYITPVPPRPTITVMLLPGLTTKNKN